MLKADHRNLLTVRPTPMTKNMDWFQLLTTFQLVLYCNYYTISLIYKTLKMTRTTSELTSKKLKFHFILESL